jgi:hypothetical protein
MDSTYNGSLISTTLPSDTKYAYFTVQAGLSSSANLVSFCIGEALIDTSDHSFVSVLGGSRLNRSPYEYTETENKTLLGSLPGTILNLADHTVKVTTYSGAGNLIVVSGTQINESILDPSGTIKTVVCMTLFRRS